MPTPRKFFNDILKPSYEAWLSDPLSEWKAKAAVANADIMAERVFNYLDTNSKPGHARANSARDFRTHLRRNVCADFGLVWDIHDGHKHLRLDRPNRQITNASQTGVGRMGFGEGSFGEGVFGGGSQIIVRLDDGSKRALSGVMENVLAMWKAFLAEISD